MARNTFLSSIEVSIDRYLAIDQGWMSKFADKNLTWNNLSYQDLVEGTIWLRENLQKAKENDALKNVPYNFLQGVESQLNNLSQYLSAFSTNGDTTQFSNSLSITEAIKGLMFNYGILYAIDFSNQNVNSRFNAVQNLEKSLSEQKVQFDQLRKQALTLLEDATSGTLSGAFYNRSKSVSAYKKYWLIAFVIMLGGCLYVGANILGKVDNGSFTEGTAPTKISPKMQESKTPSKVDVIYEGEDPVVGETIKDLQQLTIFLLLRFLILGPLIYGMYFCISQYNRERKIEEDYAHKEAISKVLPNYGQLISDTVVKDNLMSSASAVIFSAPDDGRTQNKKTLKSIISETKELVDLVSRFGTGKKE
jgi:hypothetical protein